MIRDRGWASTLFDVGNHVLLAAVSLICIAPMIHLLAVSLSSRAPAAGGFVVFWPVKFTTANYEEIFKAPIVYKSFAITVQRTVIGTILNMGLTVLTAYPLSKTAADLKGRNVLMWIVVFAMLFSGGLIPWFLVIRRLGLLNKLGALVLPGALPIWNVILMVNFFKAIPREIEDAAYIDGASHWRMLCNVFLPLSVPALATLTLFAAVRHWNSWFDGMILMADRSRYPLQTFLRTVVVELDLQQLSLDPTLLYELSDRAAKAATIFVSTAPILVVYPFLQRYFISGIQLGAIKG